MIVLNVMRNGNVYDGDIKLELRDEGDNWRVYWSTHIRLGIERWGQFIGGAIPDQSGNLLIPKAVLSDANFRDNNSVEFGGVTLHKEGGLWRFAHGPVSGLVEIRLDGDPVEPIGIDIETPVGRIQAHV